MHFEWDPEKARRNEHNHDGVTFDGAAYVFGDRGRLVELDIRGDYSEERWVTIGSARGRMFVVVYTESDAVIRIISARKADSGEEAQYYSENFG